MYDLLDCQHCNASCFWILYWNYILIWVKSFLFASNWILAGTNNLTIVVQLLTPKNMQKKILLFKLCCIHLFLKRPQVWDQARFKLLLPWDLLSVVAVELQRVIKLWVTSNDTVLSDRKLQFMCVGDNIHCWLLLT